ncbi:ABC transporter permease subunit [Aeromonas diversa]|uniref:Peptide ABC transporter permease SapC n=1 Tax=Aeromonas diversa CDC 2478-85 TaxID=1268237 RepID=N9TWN7_9GAMM|nr:ABC transporter permease subunit [Aeromonas diversa]ENY70549.1 peptide ABC transporter permease SapC [Aeromonas diversa CDC 2478-85]
MQDNLYPELRILSPFEQTWASFRKKPLAMAAFWCLLGLLVVTLVGPWLVPYGIDEQHNSALLMPPSWSTKGSIDYFLGTDDLGRDILSRLVVGARLTFGCALLAVVIALLLGTGIGVLGGMTRGIKSSVLNHLLDTLLSIPSLLLAIIMVAILGPGLGNTLIAITLALIPQFIRATHNAVHDEIQKEYVIASQLDGSPPLRILRLAVLPNIVDTLVTQTTRALSAAILDISAVGFLGLGAQSPQPEWGAMLAESGDLVYLAPWTVTLPGIAIFFTVLVTNMVGEGIREALKEGED